MAKKELDEELIYVYVFLCELEGTLRGICKVNTNYEGLEEILESWRDVSDKKFEKYCASAKAGIKKLMELEPTLAEGKGILEASVVEKNIVVLKRGNWERRVAVCANADCPVIKRIPWSDVYDFGEEWFGVPCSEEYWDAVCEAYDAPEDVEWSPVFIEREIEKMMACEHSARGLFQILLNQKDIFYIITHNENKKIKQTTVITIRKNEKLWNEHIAGTRLFTYKETNSKKEDPFELSFPKENIAIDTAHYRICGTSEWDNKDKQMVMKMWFGAVPRELLYTCEWE